MKRTKLMNIKYPHYYPVGLSGGNLCGLFIPPGIKTNNKLINNFKIKHGRCIY